MNKLSENLIRGYRFFGKAIVCLKGDRYLEGWDAIAFVGWVDNGNPTLAPIIPTMLCVRFHYDFGE